MYKKTLSACALLLLSMTGSYAGSMGSEPLPILIPFVAGEGLYSWPEVDGFHIGVFQVGTFTSTEDENGWGGRLAVGAIHPVTETWAATAEMGWGYYGSIDLHPVFTVGERSIGRITVAATEKAFEVSMNQYGFDVLAGIMYMKPKYDLFFKAGALAQDVRLKVKVDPRALSGGNGTHNFVRRLPGNYEIGATLVNILPELKLGGGYHINKNFLATLSWMHAFGSEFSFDLPAMSTSPVVIGSLVGNFRAPTLDVVLFGLEYRFL